MISALPSIPRKSILNLSMWSWENNLGGNQERGGGREECKRILYYWVYYIRSTVSLLPTFIFSLFGELSSGIFQGYIN